MDKYYARRSITTNGYTIMERSIVKNKIRESLICRTPRGDIVTLLLKHLNTPQNKLASFCNSCQEYHNW